MEFAHAWHTFLLTEFSCDMQYCSSNVVPWEHCHRKWIMAFPSNKTMLINTCFSLVYLHLGDDVDSTLVNCYFEVSSSDLNVIVFHEKHLIDWIFIHPPPDFVMLSKGKEITPSLQHFFKQGGFDMGVVVLTTQFAIHTVVCEMRHQMPRNIARHILEKNKTKLGQSYA